MTDAVVRRFVISASGESNFGAGDLNAAAVGTPKAAFSPEERPGVPISSLLGATAALLRITSWKKEGN